MESCGREVKITEFEQIKDPAIKNKIGFIKIAPILFRTEGGVAILNALYKVVTPLRSISYDRCIDACERMMCYCEQFREIEISERAPEYIATFTRSEDGTITLTDLKENEVKIY